MTGVLLPLGISCVRIRLVLRRVVILKRKGVRTVLYLPREEGQGLVEYALILVLVAIVVIVILALLGPAIGNIFSNIVTNI